MATPDTNLASTRGPADVNGNHAATPPSRHLHNFNTFQFVSQLVSATPPYLFNMSSPFPGNFFSDLLRRMAPRAGTPGLPFDANLQQHIRAALLAKGTPPPTVMPPPPLDLASLAAAQHRQQQQALPPTPSQQDKGVKRSLFSDVTALSSREDENGVCKRPRVEESREDRREYPPEGLTAPFLLQPPFLPSTVPPPPDVIAPWSTRASLMRPQMPMPAHVPPNPLDPYRLLLDLRLAGQLRSMAASQQTLHHKDVPLSHSTLGAPTPTVARGSPPRETHRSLKDESTVGTVPIQQPQQSTVLRGDESRVSAFHPPGRTNDAPPDTSDEEGCDGRSTSRNSCNSSTSSNNKDNLGTQYIFKHLTEIYRTIDIQRNEKGGVVNDQRSGYPSAVEVVHPEGKLNSSDTLESRAEEIDKPHINGNESRIKPIPGSIEPLQTREYFPSSNGHAESRMSPTNQESDKDSRRRE